MRKVTASARLTVVLLAVVCGAASQELNSVAAIRFAAVDVYIDSQEPLAAWQFELSDSTGLMTVVGIENGESNEYQRAPYYDLDAVRSGTADRIIVADFSMSPSAALPTGRTRIATVHLRLAGGQEPVYNLRLIAAGSADGHPIDARISLDTSTER